jgi:hypothetical protein
MLDTNNGNQAPAKGPSQSEVSREMGTGPEGMSEADAQFEALLRRTAEFLQARVGALELRGTSPTDVRQP